MAPGPPLYIPDIPYKLPMDRFFGRYVTRSVSSSTPIFFSRWPATSVKSVSGGDPFMNGRRNIISAEEAHAGGELHTGAGPLVVFNCTAYDVDLLDGTGSFNQNFRKIANCASREIKLNCDY